MTIVLFVAALGLLFAGLDARTNGHGALGWVLVSCGVVYALTAALIEIVPRLGPVDAGPFHFGRHHG